MGPNVDPMTWFEFCLLTVRMLKWDEAVNTKWPAHHWQSSTKQLFMLNNQGRKILDLPPPPPPHTHKKRTGGMVTDERNLFALKLSQAFGTNSHALKWHQSYKGQYLLKKSFISHVKDSTCSSKTVSLARCESHLYVTNGLLSSSSPEQLTATARWSRCKLYAWFCGLWWFSV